jgi:hypothetical protein
MIAASKIKSKIKPAELVPDDSIVPYPTIKPSVTAPPKIRSHGTVPTKIPGRKLIGNTPEIVQPTNIPLTEPSPRPISVGSIRIKFPPENVTKGGPIEPIPNQTFSERIENVKKNLLNKTKEESKLKSIIDELKKETSELPNLKDKFENTSGSGVE